MLRRNYNNFRRRCVCQIVIGHNLHPAAGADRRSRVRHGVKAESLIMTGNHDVLKNLPWTAKIDNHCPLGNKKSNGDTPVCWSFQSIWFSGSRRNLTENPERSSRDEADPGDTLEEVEGTVGCVHGMYL